MSPRARLEKGMVDKKDSAEDKPAAAADFRRWLPVVAVAWLIPGGGHFMLQRRGRAYLLFGAVFAPFVIGLMTRGAMFSPQTGDLFTTIIYCGGFLADIASGILYFLTTWLGYAQQEMAGHVHDYGTKFLVAAGLINILAMVDAYEIAVGKKN